LVKLPFDQIPQFTTNPLLPCFLKIKSSNNPKVKADITNNPISILTIYCKLKRNAQVKEGKWEKK
jgi:hypothetical protein